MISEAHQFIREVPLWVAFLAGVGIGLMGVAGGVWQDRPVGKILLVATALCFVLMFVFIATA